MSELAPRVMLSLSPKRNSRNTKLSQTKISHTEMQTLDPPTPRLRNRQSATHKSIQVPESIRQSVSETVEKLKKSDKGKSMRYLGKVPSSISDSDLKYMSDSENSSEKSRRKTIESSVASSSTSGKDSEVEINGEPI